MTAADRIKLSIVIVNWNTRDLLKQCLGSFLIEDFKVCFEVIVVDNCSTDGSVEMVKRDFPSATTIENRENVGFSKANNQAIKAAKGEYILLLNSDTIIRRPQVFGEWVKFMDSHPEAAASGCRLVFPDGSHQVGDAGFKPSIDAAINHSFFLSRLFPHILKGLFLSYGSIKNVVEVDWVSGAALLIRASVLPKVGLLNEEVFMFAEDVEWGCRTRSFGYKIFYLPYLEIVHLQGSSIKKQNNQEVFSFLWLENLRRLYSFYHKNEPLIFYDLLMCFGFLSRGFIYYAAYLIKRDEGAKIKSGRMFAFLKYSARNPRGINAK